MKILIYSHEFPPSPGGAGVFSRDIADVLYDNGEDIHVLAEKRKADKNHIKFNYPVTKMPAIHQFKFFLLIGLIYLHYVRKKYKINTIIATDAASQRVISVYNMFKKTKYVILSHGSEVVWAQNAGKIKKYFFKKLYKQAHCVIANSHYTKKLVLKFIPKNKICIIHPGINIKKFNAPVEKELMRKIKDKYGLEGKKIILSFSRLARRKGQEYLIRAMPKILTKVPDAVCVISGRGRDEGYFRKVSKEYKFSGEVVFITEINQALKLVLFDIADIYVLPFERDKDAVESFGITFLEAAMRKTPAVAGNIGGTSEAVIDNYTGLMVSPGNVEETAEAVIKLLTDNELANRLGNNAYRNCIEHHDFKKKYSKFMEAIK